MRLPEVSVSVVLLLLWLGSQATAEPPWNVDDPGTTPEEIITLYANYSAFQQGTINVESHPTLATTIGMSSDTEFGASVAAVSLASATSSTSKGVGDLTLGLKHRLMGTIENPILAVAYQASFPTGQKKVTSDSVDHTLYLTSQTDSEYVRLNWNVGFNQFVSQHTFSPFYGVVVDKDISEKMVLGIQFYGNAPQFNIDSYEFATGIGGRYQLRPSCNFQVMIGRSLTEAKEINTYIGLTIDLDTH